VALAYARGERVESRPQRPVPELADALQEARARADAIYMRRMVASIVEDDGIGMSQQRFARTYTATTTNTEGTVDVAIDTQPDTAYWVQAQISAPDMTLSTIEKTTTYVRVTKVSRTGFGSNASATVSVLLMRP
jgi:phosphomevalonate kinase